MHLLAIGGSDAGISAALRARELDPSVDVTVLVADEYPNFSICGIPYLVSGEVTHWTNLAHRTIDDLQATGMRVALNTRATSIDTVGRQVHTIDADDHTSSLSFDQLVVGTGARSVRPPIGGLSGDDALGPADGVHLLHSMGDTFDILRSIDRLAPERAVIVGAGYIGLEMSEGLHARGIAVTVIEQLPEVLATVDPALGTRVHEDLLDRNIAIHTDTAVTAIERAPKDSSYRLRVVTASTQGTPSSVETDLVLVVVGVRPDTELATSAGATLGANHAIAVDQQMRTNLERVFAAGDCAVTHHRLLGATYLPLGTTAHKQGRVAGENALGGEREFEGSLGTQVVKIFDKVVARTGLKDHEALSVGFSPITHAFEADDHKAYYPGSHKIAMRVTGDQSTGRLLGVQLYGHLSSEIAKRIDIAATAIFHGSTVDEMSDLDLSYTPPLGSPWDALQLGAQHWVRTQSTTSRQHSRA